MLRWILLLGILVIGGVLWNTRLPPSVSLELPDPPKAEPVPVLQPVVERVFGLWSAPESHFWSDNLRVGPPQVARVETVPHGPRVGEQAGYTRPYLGSTREASVWTQLIRQVTLANGVSNPLDKSFASSGVMERLLNNTLTLLFPSPEPPVEPVPEIEGVLDGGNQDGGTPIVLDAGDEGADADVILNGGDVNGL